mgnify:CR=1 FL=1
MEPQKYQPEDQIINFSLEMTVKCMNNLSIFHLKSGFNGVFD